MKSTIILSIALLSLLGLGIYCKHEVKPQMKLGDTKVLGIFVRPDGTKLPPDVYLRRIVDTIRYDSSKNKSVIERAELWGAPVVDSVRDKAGKPILDSITKKPSFRIAGYDLIPKSSLIIISTMDYDSLMRKDTLFFTRKK